MAVDHLDRAIVAPGQPSSAARVGHGVGRTAHGGSALIRRVVALAVGLVDTVAHTAAGLVRSVSRSAVRLVNRVLAVGALIIHRVVGVLRRATS